MERSQVNVLDDAMLRLTRRASSWVLGAGLLSLHATVFTLAMISMVFWNIYDSPDDLWVGDVFRRWGALLAFHAIAVGAGWTAWKLMRSEQEAVDAANREWRPALAPTEQLPVSRFGAPAYPIAANWSAPEPEPESPTGWQRSSVVAQRIGQGTWKVGVVAAAWATVAGKYAATAVSDAKTRFGANGGSATDASNPVNTWPEAQRPRTDDEEFIARFSTPPAVDGTTPQPQSDVVVGGVTAVTAELIDSQPHIPIVKDANATWVETAASSWLPRPPETSAVESQNGRHREPEISPPATTDDMPIA